MPADPLERRLAAVMFTDMVGYTTLILADEGLGLDKRERYWSALEMAHEADGGTIVQRLGDGSMSMFPSAREAFLESAQAYQDIASVRGVGLSLIGLAAAGAAEGRNGDALQIAAAAEVYAGQEGIVNVYTEQPVGRDFVDGARAALSPEDVAHATEAGRRVTIREALDLARGPA